MTGDARHGYAPFAHGFRPFFLAAGLYAVVAIGAWAWILRAGASPFGPVPPQLWHGHEMLSGFLGAAIAGFLLTAVPSWTGSRGIAVAYVLLLAAAVVRVFAPALAAGSYLATLEGAALLWMAAFAIYAVVYAPIFVRARADGKPG